MTTIIKKKTGYQNAKLWRDAQYNSGNTDPVLYMFILVIMFLMLMKHHQILL
jgi:hypothetical protein